MARDDKPLEECPLCKSPVEGTKIGLRDFHWVNQALPGRVGGMDIDFCLNQSKTGRVLMMSLMAKGYRISIGERITYAIMRAKGIDVWYLWDMEDGNVRRGVARRNGYSGKVETFTKDQVAALVREWWDEGVS